MRIMKILGIDSSGLVASAAIADEKNIIAEFTVNNKQTHSQTLLPMIEKVVDMSGIELEQIDAIAIAAGPGSFTGLRIGSATAKGIGLALKKPVVSVPTLEGLAYRVSVFDGIICPIMDARRNQVYTGIYKMDKGNLVCLSEQKAVDIFRMKMDMDMKEKNSKKNIVLHRFIFQSRVRRQLQFWEIYILIRERRKMRQSTSLYILENPRQREKEKKG